MTAQMLSVILLCNNVTSLVETQLCTLNSKMNLLGFLWQEKNCLSKSAFALLNHYLIVKTDWAIFFSHY